MGNTNTKVGVFENDLLIYDSVYTVFDDSTIDEICECYKPGLCILCNVSKQNSIVEASLKNYFPTLIVLDEHTPIPIRNEYRQPETLGKDRLAAVIGANYLKPNSDLLVVDAGTAITYDFIDANSVFHGGNIAPGLSMRFKALNVFTAKLPLVEPSEELVLFGKSTTEAIHSGVVNGIVFEIKGYFEALKIKYPELSIFLTGGNLNYFVSKLKSPIFAERNLVLIGLNRILQFNVKK
jgi:type III pantothenate kinase